jgi:glycosyltransferase involved in cell wall biosynthesis
MDMSYWHGFGRMGIESMASGAVPILSDSGGIRTYAKHEENCFVVSLDDLDSAADRIVQLLKDRELRLGMRKAGLESVQRFSESAAVDDWFDLMRIAAPKSGDEGLSFPGVQKKSQEHAKVVNLK